MLSVFALVQGVRSPVVKNHEVRLSSLPGEMDSTVIVAMSDLHLGSQLNKQWLEARVAQVRALLPDLVVLLGDLFEGQDRPQGDLFSALRRLSPPLGVWAVTGNHEFYGSRGKEMLLGNEANIQLLRNRWVEIRPGFVLAGVDDLTTGRRNDQEATFLTGACGSTSGCHRSPFPHAVANRKSGEYRCRLDALWAHPWRANMALQLSGPVFLPISGGAV